AQSLLGQKSSLLLNPKQMVPSWTETGARLLVTRFLNQYVTIGNMTILEEGGTMFSFGEVDKKCLVKTVLRVHDPLFYWKVRLLSLLIFSSVFGGYFPEIISCVKTKRCFRSQPKRILVWLMHILMVIFLLLIKEKGS
uniref:Uncharacterized protein n=1 Tax=Aegilops tauschii subsp. strangulata TaxID=200361 RepID=A0A453ACY8_AEGTS